MLVHFLSSASPQAAVAPATAEQHAKPPAAPAQPPSSATVSTPTARPVEASKPEPATEIKPIAPVKEEKLPPPPQKEKPAPVKPSEPAVAAPTAPESKSEGQPDESRKFPVPDNAAQDKAKKVVDDLFKEELGKAKTSAARQSLAKKLLQQGIDTPNDAGGRFVLFDTARELAVGANDAAVAFDVIDKMAEYFDVDAFDMKEEALTALAKSAHAPSAHQAIAEKALNVTQKAIDENNFDAAKELGKLALAEANKSRDKSVIQQVRSTGKNLQSAEKAFAEVEEAFNTLKERPEDLDANAIVGKYTCFVKGNWDTGLPMLRKGSDTTLKDIATMDLRKPVKPEEQVAEADAWYELAGKEARRRGRISGLRAAHWYWLAFPDMKGGLEKVRVEKRMKGLAPLVASLPVPRLVVNKIDGSELVLIPAGKFLAFEEKIPLELPAFYLAACPVTNAQYKKFVDATGRPAPKFWDGKDFPASRGDNAVVGVTWYDAESYCKWAGVRLPTEPERDKGARGTEWRIYPWGDKWDIDRIWRDPTDPKQCDVKSHPGARSPYGLYDMTGNVWEWLADWSNQDSRERHKRGNLSPPKPDASGTRVLSGHAWELFRAKEGFHDYGCGYRISAKPEARAGLGFPCRQERDALKMANRGIRTPPIPSELATPSIHPRERHMGDRHMVRRSLPAAEFQHCLGFDPELFRAASTCSSDSSAGIMAMKKPA